MEYVDDRSSVARGGDGGGGGMTAVPRSTFVLSSPDYDGTNDDEENNSVSTHLQVNHSSPSSYLASRPSSSSGSGTASGSGSELGDYFMTEPDLQMSRANWWQDLVTIYHSNPEIGTKLVMGDILHLYVGSDLFRSRS